MSELTVHIRRRAALAALFVTAGCGSSGAVEEGGATASPQSRPVTPSPQAAALPPQGYGTLRQDAFTVTIETADRVQVKLTPLAEGVIRLAAPDTYQRLHSLVSSRYARIGEIAERAGLRREPLVSLVSFFTRDFQKEFEPSDVQILSRGILYRPLGIIPLTPDWGRQQLIQEKSESALYVFEPTIDLEIPFQVEYASERSFAWAGIIGVLDAERARVFSRAQP